MSGFSVFKSPSPRMHLEMKIRELRLKAPYKISGCIFDLTPIISAMLSRVIGEASGICYLEDEPEKMLKISGLSMTPDFILDQLCGVVDLDGRIFTVDKHAPRLNDDDGSIGPPPEVWSAISTDHVGA